MRRRRGYTLMELIMVLAIIVVLGALAFPSVESMYATVQQDAGVDAVRAAWADAAAHAVEEGRAYRFGLVAGNGKYRVAPHGSEFWEGEGAPADSDTNGPPYILENSLPKGVSFDPEAGEAGAGGFTTSAVFLPDGTAQDDAEVTIHADGVKPVTLQLRGLTGVVSIRRGN